MRRFIPALLVVVSTVLAGAFPARSAELIMFEQAGCVWCAKWNQEIAPAYAKSEEGSIAPLRRVDIHEPLPDDLAGIRVERFTPTFVLVEDGEEIGRMRDNLRKVLSRGRFEPEEMGRVETELHSGLVLRCAKEQMRKVLVRCQLPIISTFDTVERNMTTRNLGSGLREAVEDHETVLNHLLEGDADGAANALEHHLHRAFELCGPHFRNLRALPAEKLPPYMVRET
mgnify:CR=1 FL=1